MAEFAPQQPLLGGRYVVENVVGRSASGTIYRLRSRPENTLRTLLVVNKATTGVQNVNFYRALFRRAAALAGRLQHPHIAHIVEWAEDERYLYLVSEYTGGGSLRRRLQEGPLPWPEAVRIALEVATALEALHTQLHAIHRDVRPANILLDEDGRAILGGLGLAQLPDESERAAQPRRHPGAPAYMSPEQAGTSDYLSPSADVYSLGCVLFEMLTGRPWKEVRHQVEGPRQLRPEIPDWLDAAVRRMLRDEPGLHKADAADPRKRFLDMAAVRQALTPPAPTDGRPGMPPAATAAGDRTVRRQSARWLLLAGTAVLLPGLVMLGAWGLRHGVLGVVDGVSISAEPSWLALLRVAVGLWGLLAALGLSRGQRWGRSLGLLFALLVEVVGLLVATLIVTQLYVRGTQHYFAAYLWAEMFLALVGFSGGIVLASRLERAAVLRSLGLTPRRPAGILPIAIPLFLTLLGVPPAIGLLHNKEWGRKATVLLLIAGTVLAGIATVSMAAGMQMNVCRYINDEYACSGPVPNPWGSALAVTAGLVIVSWCLGAAFYLGSEEVRSWFKKGKTDD